MARRPTGGRDVTSLLLPFDIQLSGKVNPQVTAKVTLDDRQLKARRSPFDSQATDRCYNR
jgi:hypothetical protein